MRGTHKGTYTRGAHARTHTPTADGDAQLHPPPLGQLHGEGAAAGDHRL